MLQKQYLCIDLKSFFASVECVERGLDPMTTNLVVADPERGNSTICLAVTPAMKALGVRNRCRVFEIPSKIDYIMAPPRMQKYIDYAADIYAVYLRYISPDDIHVYSIDEAFLDVTQYLLLYNITARELAEKMMNDIYVTLGIRATCGIGSNLYLAKIALDIMAKRSADFVGVLDEESYCNILWNHRPITDFWRIGKGTATTLAKHGVYTMGQIAMMPEELLYAWFGIDAELLIDHAWGRETTTIADIKSYRSKDNCLCSGQVLMRDYSFEEGLLIVREMTDLLCLDLVAKRLVTQSITLRVGYSNSLHMEPVHGTAKVSMETNADSVLIPAVASLYERIIDKRYPVRRVDLCCNQVVSEEKRQISLFEGELSQTKNHRIQTAVLEIKKKYGKNSILKGMNFQDAAMTRERNGQIGGHKSGKK